MKYTRTWIPPRLDDLRYNEYQDFKYDHHDPKSREKLVSHLRDRFHEENPHLVGDYKRKIQKSDDDYENNCLKLPF